MNKKTTNASPEQDAGKKNISEAAVQPNTVKRKSKTKKKTTKEEIKDLEQLAEIPLSEQPYSLPEGWKWVRLGDVITLISGRDVPVRECNNKGEGIPYLIGASNLNNNSFKVIRWIKNPEVISKAQDILITVKGTIGKLYIQKEDAINLSRQVMALRAKATLNNIFLYYYLVCYKNELENLGNGLIPGLTREVINGFLFLLPPLPTQQRIVEAIERLFKKLDDAAENLKSVIACVDQRKTDILRLAFSGALTAGIEDSIRQEALNTGLPDSANDDNEKDKIISIPEKDQPYPLPEGWKWVRVGDVCKFMGGGTPDKGNSKYWNGSIPWASVKDIKSKYLKTTQDMITGEGLKNSSAKQCNENDVILITRISPGNASIAKIKAAINQDLKIVKSKLPPEYLYYFFQNIKSIIEKLSNGTTVKGIAIETIKKIPFPLPPLPTQQRIVEIIESLFNKENQIKQVAEESLNTIETLKKNILTLAFRGKFTFSPNTKNADNPVTETN